MIKHIFNSVFLAFLLAFLGAPFASCQKKIENKTFDCGTKSDSAHYYYHQGWQQIMDTGQWTLSEASFRRAVTFDTNFRLGKILVARISDNLEERELLYQAVEAQISEANAHERLLLTVYLSNVKRMNLQVQNPALTKATTASHRTLSEQNFRAFVHSFPEESYVKAEYIEVLHANYGAKTALDSLQKLVTARQKNVPFFTSYTALLESELGHFDEALSAANQLNKMLNDTTLPSPYVTFAAIYTEMDSLEKAQKYINQALRLDKKHLIAQGLKKRLTVGNRR